MPVNPGPQNPYQQIAVAAAQKYGLDPNIFLRQIGAESNWNPNAQSSAGAQGIAQFMPATAKGMGVNPYDPKSALYGAAKMDSGNLKKYGSYQSMLSAYNSGNPNAWKDPNFARGETANYVKKIMGGQNPYVASSGGVAPAPSGSDNMRVNLLTYLMKSNQANINHEQAPSVLPYILSNVNSTVDFGNSGGMGSSQGGNAITTAATQFLGTPYVWGGNDPSKGLDCSSFIQQTFAKVGVNLPRTTYDQVKKGAPVNINNLRPGDVVFTEPGKNGPNHVGLYIGNGIIQESPHTGTVNTKISLKDFLGGGFVAARRYTR